MAYTHHAKPAILVIGHQSSGYCIVVLYPVHVADRPHPAATRTSRSLVYKCHTLLRTLRIPEVKLPTTSQCTTIVVLMPQYHGITTVHIHTHHVLLLLYCSRDRNILRDAACSVPFILFTKNEPSSAAWIARPFPSYDLRYWMIWRWSLGTFPRIWSTIHLGKEQDLTSYCTVDEIPVAAQPMML